MIFFHDKHWFRSEPLFSVEEEDEDEEDEDEERADEADEADDDTLHATSISSNRPLSPSHSDTTAQSTTAAPATKKTEYEFLLFNYLLRFVHREGKIGDFARAGLLFLMDVAMSPGEVAHPLVEHDASTSAVQAPPTDPITDAALALAEYIIDGDFSEVLGAGLAAVYSLLPSKLEIKPTVSASTNTGSMVLGSTGVETEDEKDIREFTREKNLALGLEDSTNPDFKGRLEHFLKLLEFLQDILRRNVHASDEKLDPSTLVGNAIVNSILDAVRRTFLENVLYPSILECSDADGSAVAVMSYIEAMIATLQHDQLADLLVEFLMSEDSDAITRPRHKQAVVTLGQAALPPSASTESAKSRRRKSTAMQLLEMEAPESTKQSEYFTTMSRYTLKDLLMANLRSEYQPTAAAALQLLQTMLVEHCQICMDKLMIVFQDPNATCFPEPAALFPISKANMEGDDDDEDFVYPGTEAKPFAEETYPSVFGLPDVTISTHEREMNLYLTLISRVDPAHNEDAFSTGYDNYLQDALLAIEEQACFHADLDAADRRKRKHRLNPNDRMLTLILESLRTFFANTPEFNVSLTGMLATLALCPDRSLSGWLTFALKEKTLSATTDDTLPDLGVDDRSIDFEIEEKLVTETNILPAASVDEQARPIVHTVLLGLVTQLDRYRQQVEHFDKYLLERRQGLLFSENLTDALTLTLEPHTLPTPTSNIAPGETPVKPKPKQTISSSFVSFFTPTKAKHAASSSISAVEAASPPREGHRHVDASPFGPHYQQTVAVSVEPYIAPIPASSSWIPAKPALFTTDDDDPFSETNQWGNSRGSLGFGQEVKGSSEVDAQVMPPKKITLSHLLDNVVILEESMKELVAVIQARRSLGIDSLRYV
jgi:hypothetical protein